MAIVMYKHNMEAYNKAVAMIEDCGKAAVVHPTGTGKSFIGFKLCEDNPESNICWLSPSEYIYKTQLENLGNSMKDSKPKFNNVTFLTYAKLSIMDDSELEDIKPDYIVLDEFHRCGALVWGTGVQRLLAKYPEAKILGLSATAIRYLDNQRDMADELFDGNVASEMSLGEAIVRGILSPPRYVLSFYSYSDDLVRYENQIKKLRYKAQREKADRYLEALRRALDKAEGMNVIFDKYMTDRTGKYIVFCSTNETMQEAIGKVPEWFGDVDEAPHIYSVYSDDPEASSSFRRFKKDDDNTHMRLLFCIDALNEGVHVDNISGVILLRPTISPIVYKQQIGRALAAGNDSVPVIFDIVGNIKGLYSIDSVREEMEAALIYIRANESTEEIVNENFEVFGELRNCLELFGELEGYLSSSWDVLYLEAKQYYEEKGDIDVPINYVSVLDDPNATCRLGVWVSVQRDSYLKKRLSDKQIKLLEDIEISWDMYDIKWEKAYTEAVRYTKEYGDINSVPASYSSSGIKLLPWIRAQRSRYNSEKLSSDRINKLEQIGIVWNPQEAQWECGFAHAQAYVEKYGNLKVPKHYVCEDGYKLKNWLNNQNTRLKNGRMTNEQKQRLEMIGMVFTDRKKEKIA